MQHDSSVVGDGCSRTTEMKSFDSTLASEKRSNLVTWVIQSDEIASCYSGRTVLPPLALLPGQQIIHPDPPKN
jgi:hypothetical protein